MPADGLGRARASVARHTQLFQATWLVSGHALLSKKGAPVVQFDTAETSSEPGILQALALPTGEARSETTYDAFDRPLTQTALHLPGESGAPSAMEYGALSTTQYDPNDLGFGVPAGRNYGHMAGTPSVTRVDGHGRTIESIEMLVQKGESAATGARYLRLGTAYFPNGGVYAMMRAETTHGSGGRSAMEQSANGNRVLQRLFLIDTAGRRVGTIDPDTMNPAEPFARANWRYLYNRVGDLVAVRDPRGCGQDFFYDRAGRLVGEDYVGCAEAQDSGDDASGPGQQISGDAIGLDVLGAPISVTVAYHFDELPGWAMGLGAGDGPPVSAHALGRATGVSDRAQRTATAYDERGNPVWTARQMAQLQPKSSGVASGLTGDDPVRPGGEAQSSHARTYDESETYVVRTRFDNLGRPYYVTLPEDPDWALYGNQGPAPEVSGMMAYTDLGLPLGVAYVTDSVVSMVSTLVYDRFLQPVTIVHGDGWGLMEELHYDVRHRPTRIHVHRPGHVPPSTPSSSGLAEVVDIVDHRYGWDAADNLISVENAGETGATLRDGYRPSRQTVSHDSLYRVTNVFFEYRQDDASWGTDDSTDWREERTRLNDDALTHEEADPMREKPAPMVSPLPPERVIDLVYEYDWLANMVDWHDDGTEAFYERKIGRLTNGGADGYLDGYGGSSGLRPSALYLASDLPESGDGSYDGDENRGGWLEVRYGGGGNVVGMVVRSDCRDASSSKLCHDGGALDLSARKTQLLEDCTCQQEQYYTYDWDEVNRLAEARRYDRTGGNGGGWSLGVRQRYRYDASNQRMVKQTLGAIEPMGPEAERVHLYVYPGRFERSGVAASGDGASFQPYQGDLTLGSETQYTVGGARMVWKNETDTGSAFDRDRRITYAVKDVIQSTSAVVDLESGELLELTTFYPNGARETHRTQDEVSVQPELMGFTGKEADEEVGVVYFGERYLIPRIGRWASPDPLAVHAAGGGEVLNSYHYIGGNLLQGRDPVGLEEGWETCTDCGDGNGPMEVRENPDAGPDEVGMEFRHPPSAGETAGFVMEEAHDMFIGGMADGLERKVEIRAQYSGGPETPITNAIELFEFAVGIGDTIVGIANAARTLFDRSSTREDKARAGTRVAASGAAAVVAKRSLRGQRTPRTRAKESIPDSTRPGASAADAVGGGSSAGAMARARFVPSPKHGSSARMTSRGLASRGPTNGQAALDNAVELGNGSRRVGIDYDAGEFVVFDQTNNVAARFPEFHGHVRAWSDLTPRMRSALQRAGMADRRGRILTD